MQTLYNAHAYLCKHQLNNESKNMIHKMRAKEIRKKKRIGNRKSESEY